MKTEDATEAILDLVVKVPFRGKDYIPLKASRDDALMSAMRWETKSGGKAASEPTSWMVLTVEYKESAALQMYHDQTIVRDTACVAPGWRMKEAIDLNSTSHSWDTCTSPVLNMEDFVAVHLSDCKVSDAAEECSSCKGSDQLVYRRRDSSKPYCAFCWKAYWGKK
jgi:hypothetical protein